MREVKKALRRELIAKRRGMDPAEKELADRDIFEQLKPFAEGASSVFTYASTEIEVDTRRLIRFCLEKGIAVALPISGDTELSFYFISSEKELRCGRFGIDEPPIYRLAAPDERTLCVVPALCADGSGARLGYGRGYYDRFLSGFVGKSVVLCYSSFRREVPIEQHDKRADLTIFDREIQG